MYKGKVDHNTKLNFKTFQVYSSLRKGVSDFWKLWTFQNFSSL